MSDARERSHATREHGLFVALALCCAVPMLGIIVFTTVLGFAVGPSVAVAVGLIAAGVCVAMMVQHRRNGGHAHPVEGEVHDAG